MKLLNAVAFVAFQFAFASPASALEAQPGDACPVVGRYTFSGGPELSGVTHQMVCNASNVWSSILDNDAAGNAALAHAVSLTGDISPSQITTNQNDYSPAGLSTASVLRVNSDASRNVTSLAGGADGRIVTIINVGSFPIVLKNDDGATGTAANRFALTGDLTLAAKQSAMLMYDSTASRWRQIANGTATGAAASAGGANTQMQFNSGGVLAGSPNVTWDGTTFSVSHSAASATSGISGTTSSTTAGARAVYAYASGTTGATYGLYGRNDSTTTGAVGVYGRSTGTSGTVYGVFGDTDSATGFGVYGSNSASGGTGIKGIANTGAGIGVMGATSSATGYAGYFNNTAGGYSLFATGGRNVLNGTLETSADISPVQITANQNDYNPAGLSTASVLRLNSDASRNITSLAGGADGRIVTVMNIGSFPIVLKNDDGATGTAVNRFLFGADVALNANQSLTLIYDNTTQRWRSVGTLPATSAAAGGSDRQIQFNNAGALGGVANFEFNTDGHLDYWENLTTTAGGSYAHARFHADVAPTAAQASGRTTRGLQGAIWISAGNTNQVRKVIGSDGFAQNLGTGAIESIMGVQGYTYNNGSAAITNMFGSYTGVESTTGTVTSMLGTDIDTLVSGGTVSNVYGLLVNNQITGGAVTNRYGIYMNPPTGSATNDWGIYQDGSQNNRFNGKIGVGAAPSASAMLYGYNAVTSGTTFGVYGNSASSGSNASGVYGYASAATGTTNGVFGESVSSSNNASGVYGYASAATGSTVGVYGKSASSSSGASGVYGDSTAATGATNGVSGRSASSSNNASGVYGYASAATGSTNGVFGESVSSSNNASGVYGYASAATGSTIGVYGKSASSSSGASGVFGYATASSGATNGVSGLSDSTDGWGVFGHSTATSGSYAYGVRGETESTGGIGVSGYAHAATGSTYGTSGWSESTSGYGVYGWAAASSGTTYGVYGGSNSTGGYGVYAQNSRTSGYGLYCNSGNNNGCGGNRAWYNSSDARLKDHITDLKPESGLGAIMRLRPVRYQWKDTASSKQLELGFLAQDVEKVLPELVSVGPDQKITTSDGKTQVIDHALTMSYSQMVVPLVKAVQELKAENDALRARLERLESEAGQQAESRNAQSRNVPSNPPLAIGAGKTSPHHPAARNSRLR